jgi:hypothetical protein
MSKLVAVISCPADTYSGYGARARDFIKAVIKSKPDWEVKILSQRWGNTRFGYLEDHNEKDLLKRIVPNISSKPDIWIQITVPNEFQPVGRYNIGVTACIETTLCHGSWIEGVNRMDLTLTSSNHGKIVFENSKYEIQDNSGEKRGVLELSKPVEVLFEGVDTTKYHTVKMPDNNSIVESLNSIKESFCFLIVGHWLQGDLGQDRKNIGLTIERFLTAFKFQQKKPALVIKTQASNSSLLDQSSILEKIDAIRKQVGGNLPNIYLIHGELPDEDINLLYNHPKIKAMVSLTKGEGFGRPLLEFTTTGKPIIASAWSGHTDFLRKDLNLLVGGNLIEVHDSAVVKDMILKESKWFEADGDQAVKAYKEVYKKYNHYLVASKKQASVTKKYWTLDNMAETLDSILSKYVPNIPKKVELKLPSLSNIKLPENKIKIK